LLLGGKNAIVQRCYFVGNIADFGGAIANWGTNTLIMDCILENNDGRLQGGGMYLQAPTSGGILEVKQNIIRNNKTSSRGAWTGHGGGGIYVFLRGAARIHHNLIINNSTVNHGGGINCYDSSPILYNNTVYGNRASLEANGLRSYFASPTGFNNIFWDNFNEISGTFNCTYSNIQGGHPGNGNINLEPLFVNPASNDFHLLGSSPCIDAGDPKSMSDPDGTIADIGALYFDQSKFQIIGITPQRGGDMGIVSATIHGSGFKDGAKVKLLRNASEIFGDRVRVNNNGRTITATLELIGKAKGVWDVVVINPNAQQVVLSNGFTIEEGRDAQIWVDIIGRNTIRAGRAQQFTIHYGNRGNIDALGAYIWITGIPKTADVKVNFDYIDIPPPDVMGQPFVFFETDKEKIIPLFILTIPPGITRALNIELLIPDAANFELKAYLVTP
jgi:hypothetical protein